MVELPKKTGGAARQTANTAKKEEALRVGGLDSDDNFTLSETMVGFLYTFTTDVISLALDYTVIGAVISPVLRNGVAGSLWLWFRAKNDPHVTKIGRWVFKRIANVIPWIPLFVNTVMFVVEVYIHNHPEKFAVAEKVAGAAGGKV